MRTIVIQKGSGRFRTLYLPDKKEKLVYRRIHSRLAKFERKAAKAMGTENVAHGFVKGRCPITCAIAHIGYAVTISADLESWFDNITEEQIKGGLELAHATSAWALAKKACLEGAPRQGLPSSPAAANLAAIRFDRMILDGLKLLSPETVYTRYADDLTVSLSNENPVSIELVLELLDKTAQNMGWSLSHRKTKVQYARGGMRVVVGIAVGETNIRATRKARRKLRAATHQIDKAGRPSNKQRNEKMGLEQWVGLTLPKHLRPKRRIVGVNNPLVFTEPPKEEAKPIIQEKAVVTSKRRRIIY